METERSASYFKRQELMQTLEIPTISEAKEILGDSLAQVVFEQSHEEFRKDFGLTPPLEGPGDELWVSPSDLLIGKVCLKPPLTQKYIQALTHQGILKIGAEIEQKYWNEMEREKARALEEQEDFLRRMFEIQKSRLVDEIKQEQQAKYAEQLEALTKYFDGQIRELLETLENEMIEGELRLREQRRELNAAWERKLQEKVEKTVLRMTEEFLRKLAEQERILLGIFKKEIRNVENKRKCAVELEKLKCREALIQLKHHLECKNIANLMYLLCKERRRCKLQKEEIERVFQIEVHELQQSVHTKTEKIQALTLEKDRKTEQANVRERCLLEVLRQFRKFIYFALKASPTQAEFLLDIDKMMEFELEDYCITEETPDAISSQTAQTRSLPGSLDEDGGLRMLKEDKASLKSSKVIIPGVSSESEIEGESDVLPAFFFNERMYVREDFRDMFSQKPELVKKPKLWNKDVEELMKLFKLAVQKERESLRNYQISSKKSHHSYHSSVHFTENNSDNISTSTRSQSSERRPSSEIDLKTASIRSSSHSSRQSSIPAMESPKKKSLVTASDSIELRKESFKCSSRSIVDKNLRVIKKSDQRTETLSNRNVEAIIPSKDAPPTQRRTSLKDDTFNCWDESTKTKRSLTQSKLMLARDSVILRIASLERKSVNLSGSKIEMPDEESEISKVSDADSKQLSIEQDGALVKSSRLMLHCDSLEIIRTTSKISGVNLEANDVIDNETFEDVHPDTQRKSIVTFNPNMATLKDIAAAAVKDKSPRKKALKAHAPKTKAKVTGDRKTQYHVQSPDEFTADRINSLVNLIKDNPSLIRLFTTCAR